ncbi:MAG: hypothetical protein ABFD25_11865 [Clostridiaceae bacterium]
MDSKSLFELKNRLSMLPVMKERSAKLHTRVTEAENDVGTLLEKYEAESMDVEQMKAEKLSVYMLKLIGRYEGKLNKETEEMLSAKMEYDKACEKVKELRNQCKEADEKLAVLNQEKREYEEELNIREEKLRNDLSSEAAIKYRELDETQGFLSRQLVETKEALGAANRAISTADAAMDHLGSAEKWATYDVWTRGGIFSHMAKYEHIDDAEEAFHRLSSQMDDLKRELSDINMQGTGGFYGVDPTTRAVDFWFDNIFTDLNVRSRIRDDSEQLRSVRNQISGIISTLESNISSMNRKLQDIEFRKNELILSL